VQGGDPDDLCEELLAAERAEEFSQGAQSLLSLICIRPDQGGTLRVNADQVVQIEERLGNVSGMKDELGFNPGIRIALSSHSADSISVDLALHLVPQNWTLLCDVILVTKDYSLSGAHREGL
jgi:hypothetical protein